MVKICDCCKQTVDLDRESYHKLFDILKQYHKEVNEIRAEKITRNANPLALVAAAQQYTNTYYQPPKSHKSYAPPSKQSSSTRSHETTRYKGKEIAKPITPPSESASKEDSDPKQAQRDKDMQNNLALIKKYFKKIYQPTNNNLRTFSNTRNKNVNTSPRYKNDNQTGQFGNQRTVTVVGARETVGSQVVQQTRIQCFNCKEFRNFAKECRKPKRAKDYTYHKEKMFLCKQDEKGVPLQAEKSDWLEDTDEEIDEQELDAHYSFMAKIQERQHSVQPESINDTNVVEKVDSNVILNSSGMCDKDNQADQNAKECENERAELKECKSNIEEANRTRRESNRTRDRYLGALHDKKVKLAKYKTYKDRTIENDTRERKLKETLGLLAQKEHDTKEVLKLKAYENSVVKEKNDELAKQSFLTKLSYEGLVKEKNKVIKDLKLKEEKDLDKLIAVEKQLNFLNEIIYKRNQSIQTIHMLAPKSSTYNGRPSFANPKYLNKAQSEKPCLYEIPYEKDNLANIFSPDREETLTLEQESRSKLNKDTVKPYDYTKQNSLYEIFKPPSREYLDQLANANEI
ncbi:hypothetical protein Tco_1123306 [Tanacetum coccineum]|uniref:CCHC-type domain-containing protein n=1 Tax=Tanacetum coccineum TaxID=301880 RepID=A0ABQ5J421_9ASTR